MFTSLSNSWEILGQSWAVLRKNKELTLFPILSNIACLLVVASFVLPFVIVPEWGKAVLDLGNQANQVGQGAGRQNGLQPAHIVLTFLVFLFYVVNYFVIVFFNVALVSCAVIRLNGGEPTLRDGLSTASARLPQIFGWALVAATVGTILKAIEDRSDVIGRFVVGLLGVAWTVTTYLVVPILAVEGLSPFAALKRSAELLRRAWGEGLAGGFAMGLIGFLLSLPGIALLVFGVMMIPQLHWGAAVIIFGGLAYLLVTAIVLSTLKQIYLAGVYIYAAEQRIVDGFDAELLRSAFRAKGR
jgi:hypothetical protein